MEPIIQEDGSSITSTPLQLFAEVSANMSSSSYPWPVGDLRPEDRGLHLIHLLLCCANDICNGNLSSANSALDQISQFASPDGDTVQRMTSYFAEALAERALKSWNGLYRAMQITRMSDVSEETLVRRLSFDLFPFLKLAYVVTNQSIIEAMEGERVVHIIDLNAADSVQWVALIQALSARPEGPPHLRITGVHQRKEVLDQVARKLIEEAERLDLPFQFNPVVCKLDNLDIDKLRVKTGEALAISSILQLHTMIASEDETPRKSTSLESMGHVNRSSTSNDSSSSSPQSSNTSVKANSFLTALRGLSPKIMVVTEQDCNHNSINLLERLSESLNYYAALFDCLESRFPRATEKRKVEKMVLGEEIKNIISCEGGARKERHEKLDKWMHRLRMACFASAQFSYISMVQAKQILLGYGYNGYRIKEENGCLIICWQDRPLFSISSWRCRR